MGPARLALRRRSVACARCAPRRHKLTLDLRSGAGELYDLLNDPQEMDNRFGNPEVVQRELTDMIAAARRTRCRRCRRSAWHEDHAGRGRTCCARRSSSRSRSRRAGSRSRGATLVEVQTDDGITGWGEALCQGLQPPEIAAAAINHALKHLVVGADPLQPEVLWHRMYHYTRDYGQKGAVVGAISGDRHRALGHLRQGARRSRWRSCSAARSAPGRGIRDGLLPDQR